MKEAPASDALKHTTKIRLAPIPSEELKDRQPLLGGAK
jgi:hypothetical protein